MRQFFLAVLLLSGAIGTLSAQHVGKGSKRSVEVNKKIDNKVAYNYFMLDMIRDADVVYGEYEELVQRVWQKEVTVNLKGTAAGYIKKIDEIDKQINEVPVFRGGDKYKESVLEYLDAVRLKLTLLEPYGILGADAQSGIAEYTDASIAFNEATNKGIEIRNKVRKIKSEFEKTTYIE